MTRTNSSHPCLLIFDDPFQCIDGVLLFPDLLLKPVKTLQHQLHVDTDLVDVLAMTIDMPRGVLNLPLVIVKSLLLRNDIGPEVCLQSITLEEQVNLWLKSTKRLPSP